MLRQTGARVEIHDDHFPQNETDEKWLSEVGKRNWIVLTKDDRLRYRPITRAAIKSERVRVFTLPRGDLTGDEMAEIFLTALPAMKRLANRRPGPFVATVMRSGKLGRWRDI